MSDTNTDTKAPLWKQLLGAVAGATVAFVLYQGYTFTTHLFTAALPTGELPRPTATASFPAEGGTSVTAIAATSSASSSASSPKRAELGPFGTLRTLGKLLRLNPSTSSSSSAKPLAGLVTYSSVVAKGLQSDGNHVWPNATNSFPGQQIVLSSSSSSLTGPTRHRDTVAAAAARQAFLEAESTGPSVAGMPRIAGTIESTFEESLVAPSDEVMLPEEAVQEFSPEALAQQEDVVDTGTSVSAASEPEPVAATLAASVAPVNQPQDHLPQTGFGLDVLAVTAVGAVIGRRKMLKKAAK